MIVKLAIHPDQIRFWAESALSAFTTLDQETAIEIASADLRAILAYLDRTDVTTVLGVVPVERNIGSEVSVSDRGPRDKPGLKMVPTERPPMPARRL